MSTIVAVKKNGLIAIAADTLSCYGSTRQPADQRENYDKILKVGSSYIAIVGHCANYQVLEDLFSRLKKKPELDSPQSIFAFFRGIHKKLKDYYYVNPKESENDEYESSQIECLIANRHGIFGVYSLREVEKYTKYYAFGSGYEYALGAMKVAYDHYDTAKEIARIGVEVAANYDKSTGLPLTCYVIKEKA